MAPSRLLVTGASGFIGRHLVHALMADGRSVRAMVGPKTERAANLPTADVCHVDLATASAATLGEAIRDCGVVIHAAGRAHIPRGSVGDDAEAFWAVNVEGTRRLALAAATAGVRRLVFVSSIGVNGDRSGRRALTERSPVRPHSPYARSKLLAEEALAEVAADTGLELVVVRPPLVYGAGVGGNFISLMRAIDRGLPLPLSLAGNRRSAIAARNLSRFLLLAADHPAAAGELFLIADRERPSTPELVRALAHLLGRRALLLPVPPPLLRLAARLLGRPGYNGLWNSLEVETTKAETLLGWQQPLPMAEALAETVAWYRTQRGE